VCARARVVCVTVQGWCPKTFVVKMTLQPKAGSVTNIVEIPGTFCRFLLTAHRDGSVCLWDLKRQRQYHVSAAACFALGR
jgi:hypothetical protein